MAEPRVELLSSPACPHADRSERLLRRILGEEGLPVHVRRILIDDLDHAAGLGYAGSPTIRVDGRDVVPTAGFPGGSADGSVALACRVYRQRDGSMDGLVPEGAIRAGLRAWRERRDEEAARPGVLERVRRIPERTLREAFVWASRQRSMERLITSLPLTRGLVQRFVAGRTLEEALEALDRLAARGLRSTLDVLGESVETVEDARAAANRYLETLDRLVERGRDRNVSLKLTQMGLDVDEAVCRDNLRRVVRRAAEQDAFVRVDMEDHTRTDRTLVIARDLHREYAGVGVVIQSSLRRSADDVDRLVREGIRVRLCKGAYNEPSSVAFATKAEVDERYRSLLERLLMEGTYPAIATHDQRLLDHAVALAQRHGIGPERFELQMLYGIRRDLQRSLVAGGWTVRVYVPYGDEWYPYFMRRLAERPANLMFVLRSIVREGRGSG